MNQIHKAIETLKASGLPLVACGTQDQEEVYHFLAPNGNAIIEVAAPVERTPERQPTAMAVC
ncbi:MAG: hypothetical protein V1846_01760 [Candidatus Komeilibacteria bacterium]